jgi:hypothetical protein
VLVFVAVTEQIGFPVMVVVVGNTTIGVAKSQVFPVKLPKYPSGPGATVTKRFSVLGKLSTVKLTQKLHVQVAPKSPKSLAEFPSIALSKKYPGPAVTGGIAAVVIVFCQIHCPPVAAPPQFAGAVTGTTLAQPGPMFKSKPSNHSIAEAPQVPNPCIVKHMVTTCPVEYCPFTGGGDNVHVVGPACAFTVAENKKAKRISKYFFTTIGFKRM